jgi:SAM-dependent methyltransferase
VADIACGQGHLIDRISDLFQMVIGVDMIDAPSHDGYHVRADLNSGIPMSSDVFDLVVSSETIEHLPNPQQFIHELTRITKPDGVIILTTPNVVSPLLVPRILRHGSFPRFPELRPEQVRQQSGHISPITPQILASHLAVTDWEIYNRFGGFGHWPLGRLWVPDTLAYSHGFDIRRPQS